MRLARRVARTPVEGTVASGIYLLRLTQGGRRLVARTVLVR